MSFVSIYTVGRLSHPYHHPASKDFFEVGEEIVRQAAKSGQLLEIFSPDRVPFPEEVTREEGFPVITLTVWKSLQSLYNFTYSGLHKQALRDRSKWMATYQEKHLSYVIWWTDKVGDVSWKEAFNRYRYYIQNGPTPFAFDFKHAFDEKGEVISIKSQ
ncbi:DUF3291 domain-containing protein [Bacillus sp. JJ1764]|uniref:DUF3291 domain-containing protein n=1 Tax=Bacillus sp. JJ1764 TaxID=3122964 RepID=UPI003000CA33